MQQLRTLSFIALFIFLLGRPGISQAPPPPAPTGTRMEKRWEPPSLVNIKPADEYRSWEGRFSIALPKSSQSGYYPVSPESAGMQTSGATFNFEVKEGIIEFQFRDFLDKPFSKFGSIPKERVLQAGMDGAIKALGGTRIADEALVIGQVPGRKLKLKTPSGAIMLGRSFLVGDRLYKMFGEVRGSVDRAEELLDKAFASFKILEQSEIDAEVAKMVSDSMPSPLPQEPRAPKEKSDAEDENLKGNVMTVLEDDQGLSGTWKNQMRHRSSEQEFDQKGARTKRISYDSNGYPSEVVVYGYIDGARVSKSKMVSGISGSGGSIFSVKGTGEPNAKPRDPRFGYKYVYKYSSGSLIEEQLIHNDGDIWMRYEYKHAGRERTELVYSENGKLNQKYRYVLDKQGDPIEYFRYDAFRAPDKIERAYRFKYDTYDRQGNWTQRTRFEIISENGVEIEKASLIEYRMITYYSK